MFLRKLLSSYSLCFLLAVVCLSGCSGRTSIREGIWELSYTAQTPDKEPFPMEPEEVRLLIGWGKLKTIEGTIEAELFELLRVSDPDMPPIEGGILPATDSRAPRVIIDHQEEDWTIRMFGEVQSPTHVDGTHLGARSRVPDSSFRLEGRWALRWLRPLDG